jgi:hypothetical protein
MTKLYTPRDIKLALLDMFTYGLFGSANRASGEMKMKLCPDTANELEICFNIWGYKLTESKAIEWAAKEHRKAQGKKPDDAPTFYFGVEDKQSKSFFIDPVESLMGEDEIDSGKGPQDDGAIVARDTQKLANAKTRSKMNQAERDDAEAAA